MAIATTVASRQDLFTRSSNGIDNSSALNGAYGSSNGVGDNGGFQRSVGIDGSGRSLSVSNSGVLSSSTTDSTTTSTTSPITGTSSATNDRLKYHRSLAARLGYRRDTERPMYVRARFNYVADDPTSLSFKSGDIIQVMTRLESGWWDGVVHGQRGWFPSNYCEMMEDGTEGNGDSLDDGVESSNEYDSSEDNELDGESGSENEEGASARLPLEGTDTEDGESNGFWIPQATPEGRLYYFNVQTGLSRQELPLETPTSATESGPMNGIHINIPETSRPPPEVMAGGLESEEPDYTILNEDDANSTYSESNDMILLSMPDGNHDDQAERRGSFISEDSSFGPPTGDLHNVLVERARGDTFSSQLTNGSIASSIGSRTLVGSISSGAASATLSLESNSTYTPAVPRKDEKGKPLPAVTSSDSQFYGDSRNPTDWDTLVKDIGFVVDAYKQAFRQREKAQYTHRANIISDHLRLLVAAGSGTTDNHSGHHPAITANKDFYPHFKRFMAAYSKLVLSSNLAAGDWPPADAETKCLQEADEVMVGVVAFAEAAKHQGKTIPRLRPGFIVGSDICSGWKPPVQTPSTPITKSHETQVRLDEELSDRLDELSLVIKPALRQLERTLKSPGSVITREQQEVLGEYVLSAAQVVVEALRKYFNIIESINLQPFLSGSQSPTFHDFITQKQRIQDTFADLIMACQLVTAPLADEWSSIRGDSLEERLLKAQTHIRELENGMQAFTFSTQLLVGELEKKKDHQMVDLREVSPKATSKTRARTYSNTAYPGEISFKKGNATVENKLIRLLGDEAPRPGIVEQVPQPQPVETPWYLALDHDPEIQKGNKGAVKGGTLVALVEQLTRHDYLDRDFVTTFLLTYQSFTTAAELFNQLARRFSQQSPPGLSQAEMNEWVEKKQKLIRVRVFSTLKSWLESYWMEAYDDAGRELLKTMHAFVSDVMLPQLSGAQTLINALNERIRGNDPKQRVLVLNLGTQAPTPILPKSMRKIKFLDVDPMEFARQLTIMESRLYQKIKPSEFLNKSWSNTSWEQAPNVKQMIFHSNKLTNWVAEMILKQHDPKKRVHVIKHFIAVAERCRQLNNFSTVTGIISALGSSPIYRLTRTWHIVPGRTIAIYEDMRRLMGTTLNYATYREMLHIVNPPCVPFLGVYLKDLTFVADGNPDFLKNTEREYINFDKRQKTAAIIQEIQQYQSVPYPLEPVEELQTYILSNMDVARDINTTLFDVSKELEPRPEREDEKIARLLQESGFL